MDSLIYPSFVFGTFFLFVSAIFFILKEKACPLISGYNFTSRKDREKYDEKRMSEDYGILFLKYSLIFIISGIGCIFISEWSFWIGLIIWVVYFFRNVGWSNKFFDKYKIN